MISPDDEQLGLSTCGKVHMLYGINFLVTWSNTVTHNSKKNCRCILYYYLQL